MARSSRRARTASPQRARNSVLRFVGLFTLLLLGFQLAYYEFVVGSVLFEKYLAVSGWVAAALLRAVGQQVTASGPVLSADFSMSIRQGCDGLQAMAIVAMGILAFPGAWRMKLTGILSGVALLLGLNTLRIATLFWAGLHRPDWFQTLHVHVWPAFLILSAFLFWALWAPRALQRPRTP